MISCYPFLCSSWVWFISPKPNGDGRKANGDGRIHLCHGCWRWFGTAWDSSEGSWPWDLSNRGCGVMVWSRLDILDGTAIMNDWFFAFMGCFGSWYWQVLLPAFELFEFTDDSNCIGSSQELCKLPYVDSSRVYLTGVSMGGWRDWRDWTSPKFRLGYTRDDSKWSPENWL